MAVLQMLPEMIRTVKFLRIVALAKLVHRGQVLEPALPIRLRKVGKFITTIATRIMGRPCT